MASIGRVFGSGRLLAVAALAGMTIVGMVAAPIIASAGDLLGDRRGHHGPQSVEECRDRVAAEDPRRDEFLDELVGDEVISTEQAAEIDARLDSRHFDGCVARLLFKRGTAIEATANATGVEPREVLGALIAGESLSQFANARGVDDATLINAIMAASEAKAAEIVSAGELSQSEVDAILPKIEERLGEAIHQTDWTPRGIRSAGDSEDAL